MSEWKTNKRGEKFRVKAITFGPANDEEMFLMKGTRVGNLIREEGDNGQQDFVEYSTNRGRFLGMILRVKGETFWSVWDVKRGEPMVVTEREERPETFGGYVDHVIGSTDKAEAEKILLARLGVSVEQAPVIHRGTIYGVKDCPVCGDRVYGNFDAHMKLRHGHE